MAKKTNYKKKNSVTSSSKKTPAEVRDWYEKNENSINAEMFALADEQIMKIIDPQKGTNKKSSIYSAERLEGFMKNPYKNSIELRNLSRFLFNRVQIYRRLIYFNANMINLDYRSVIPRIDFNKKSNNQKKVLKAYYETLNCLDHMNLDLAFQPAVINVFREDVFYGCSYLDDESFFILPIDSDYCQITGVFGDGSLAFAMNMEYFDKNADLLTYWGEPFNSMFKAYGGNRDNKWQIMDEQHSVCIKFDLSDMENPIPPFLGMFDSFINLEDLKTNMGIIDEQDIYKLLVAEMPTKKDGIDEFLVDPATAVKYFNKMLEALPNYIGGIISPLPIKDIHFNSDRAGEVNKVQKATQTIFNSAGGAQVLNSSSISGSTAWNGAISSDEDMATSSIIPQIEAIVNRILKYQIKDASKVKILPLSTYSVDKFRDAVLKSCTYGVPNKLLLGTLNGFSELDTLSLAYLENELLDLPSKFIPLQSSNTQNTSEIGSDGGRPTAKEKGEDISDDGEASQDKRDRSK